jgi:transcriptional regulator with XRE-family HTH domain
VHSFTTYDPAEDLGSDEAIAEQTGLSREQLYRSFSSKGNPTLKTTLAVMRALGIELTAKTAAYYSQSTLKVLRRCVKTGSPWGETAWCKASETLKM